MKAFLAAMLVCMFAACTPAAAQQRMKIAPGNLVQQEMERSYVAPTERRADVVPERVYSPPPGYRVAYRCEYQCSYWLVENDTVYERAVYAAQSLWVMAVALLGLLACLGLVLVMLALTRDVLRRNGRGTRKMIDGMAA